MHRNLENDSISLPEFGPRFRLGFPASGLNFRRFGTTEEDLNIDFSERNRAALATRVLRLCTVDPGSILPDHFFSELSAGKRIECLLVLATGGLGTGLGFPFKCESCGEEMEIELTLDEIAAIQREADTSETVIIQIGERSLEFRKCSGQDQESWFDRLFTDEHEAASHMVSTLALDRETAGAIPPDEFHLIEEALDTADPLVNLSFHVSCESCDHSNQYDVDLFETALGMLERAQRRLLITVHRLASNYHWSEKEIFEVPHRRREEYLNLIGAKK